MKALPAALGRLRALVYNLRWTWDPETPALFPHNRGNTVVVTALDIAIGRRLARTPRQSPHWRSQASAEPRAAMSSSLDMAIWKDGMTRRPPWRAPTSKNSAG